jgi:hypothetical protein
VRITFGERRTGYELSEFFRRSECTVEWADEHVLDVAPVLPLLPEAAKLEIEGLLRVWCKLHPEAAVVISPPEPMGVELLEGTAADEDSLGASRGGGALLA